MRVAAVPLEHVDLARFGVHLDMEGSRRYPAGRDPRPEEVHLAPGPVPCLDGVVDEAQFVPARVEGLAPGEQPGGAPADPLPVGTAPGR